MKVRMAHVVQAVKHPETNEILLNEDVIKYALNNHKIIDKYAYVLHDKDFKVDKKTHKLILDEKGEKIPINPHWHIVLKFSDKVEVKHIAQWFGVPENQVEIDYKGYYGFYDVCTYITHKNYTFKHQYTTDEIVANFDFKEFLIEMELKKMRNGNSSDRKIKEKIRMQVMFDGMTLNEARRKNPENYMQDFKYLASCRADYLSKAKLPPKRLNYYIYGPGGSGKDLCSIALARALFPNIDDDDDLFFEVGAENVTFEGYDGQPVIIWSDCRANDLLKRLGGRGNVFNIFDTFPKRIGKQNVKYGSVNLINVVNIVNSVQSFKEFYLALSGEYEFNGMIHKAEDKKQACRRFPFFMALSSDTFDVYLNEGYIDLVMGDLETYKLFSRVRGSFKKLHNMYGSNARITRSIENRMLEGVKNKSKEIIEQRGKIDKIDMEENLAILADYGKEIDVNNEKTIKFSDENNDNINVNADDLFDEFK